MTSIPELRAALLDREANAPDGATVLDQVLAPGGAPTVSPGASQHDGHRRNVPAGARPRIRRRTVWPLLAAAVVVALVVSMALIVRGQRSAPPVTPPSVVVVPSSSAGLSSVRSATASTTAPTASSGGQVSVTGPMGANGSGSVTSLAHGSWKQLPAGPQSPRESSVTIWTGTELLIWGGQSSLLKDNYVDLEDGAIYHPVSQASQTMSPAPLAQNLVEESGVWTGSKLFVWGNDEQGAGSAGTAALYDPATNQWQQILALPGAKLTGLQAVWTGSEVLAIGWDGSTTIRLYALNVATATWTALPDRSVSANHSIRHLRAVGAGDDVFVFAAWQSSKPLQDGIDRLVYRPSAGSWTLARTEAGFPHWSEPIWVGDAVAMPAAERWCTASFACPYSDPSDLIINPATGVISIVPRRQATTPGIDAVPGAPFVWTGGALVAAGSMRTNSADGSGLNGPVLAANPHSYRWTALPAGGVYGSSAVWTGDRLLVWGRSPAASQPVPHTAFAELIPAG